MATDFTTYTGLQAAIADQLNRTDLTNEIPGFIALAEPTIRRRLRRKTIIATVALTTDTLAFPTDCAEIRSVRPVSSLPYSDKPMTLVTVADLDGERARCGAIAGRPRFYAIEGSNVRFERAPSPSFNVELRYYEKLISLATTSANSTLLEAPDVYFYGALMHSAPFLLHDDRVPLWKTMFDEAIDEMNTMRQNEEFGGALQRARLPVTFG